MATRASAMFVMGRSCETGPCQRAAADRVPSPRVGRSGQSIWTFACSTTGVHFAISAWTWADSVAGSEATISAENSFIRAATAGSAMAATAAAFSRATTSGGVPFGREERVPCVGLVARDRLGDRRHVREGGRALGRGDAEGAQAAGGEMP